MLGLDGVVEFLRSGFLEVLAGRSVGFLRTVLEGSGEGGSGPDERPLVSPWVEVLPRGLLGELFLGFGVSLLEMFFVDFPVLDTLDFLDLSLLEIFFVELGFFTVLDTLDFLDLSLLERFFVELGFFSVLDTLDFLDLVLEGAALEIALSDSLGSDQVSGIESEFGLSTLICQFSSSAIRSRLERRFFCGVRSLGSPRRKSKSSSKELLPPIYSPNSRLSWSSAEFFTVRCEALDPRILCILPSLPLA